ncbi:hypothetical protein KZX46_21340 (plasmid) [Polymorphobacter sp. PAMC 29334]|uniref:hypothetical protein n=1 Tax=Polymorphobacter sp. PAMC 29334 TaxID=2862331 RepID=UPI001C760A91|nr:hypothetical protein [Polymorphobacter sp. PAMC 29334]QYE37186.1 hypothetical protein KZX46_21340 [Polymorphobacter sp. PAMC 29334]
MRVVVRLALLGSLVPLAGCMTSGTNMHGDFSCRAPNGTCAPMTSIDAKAVAGLGATAQPIGGIVDPAMPREGRAVTASADGSPPGRTADRVLRVVFPAHIDASGIYHDEASAHAVVERGAWTDGLTGGARRSGVGTQVATSQPIAADSVQPSKLATLDEIVAGRAAQARRNEGDVAVVATAVTPTATSAATVALVTRLSMMRSPGAIDLREAAAAASAGPVSGLDPNFDTPDVTPASVDEPGAPASHCTGYRPVWWHGHAYRRLRPLPCPVVTASTAAPGVSAAPAPVPGTTAALNRAAIERTATPLATAAAAAPLSAPVAPAATTAVVTAAGPAVVPSSFAPTTDPKVAAGRVSAMAAPIVAEQVRLGRVDAKAATPSGLGSLFAGVGIAASSSEGAPR